MIPLFHAYDKMKSHILSFSTFLNPFANWSGNGVLEISANTCGRWKPCHFGWADTSRKIVNASRPRRLTHYFRLVFSSWPLSHGCHPEIASQTMKKHRHDIVSHLGTASPARQLSSRLTPWAAVTKTRFKIWNDCCTTARRNSDPFAYC